MSPTRRRYLRALDGMTSVIARFPDRRWADPSPCPSWTARQLVGHVIDGQLQVAAMLQGAHRPPTTDVDALDVLAGADPAASWEGARQELQRALAGIADTATVPTPYGDKTVAALLDTAIVDPLLHAWDLGVTDGEAVRLDPEAVAVTLAAVEELGDALAHSGMYAPALPVAPGADPQDRLLALTGRDSAGVAVAHSSSP